MGYGNRVWAAALAALSLFVSSADALQPEPPAAAQDELAAAVQLMNQARALCVRFAGIANVGECALSDMDGIDDEPEALLARRALAARTAFTGRCSQERSKGRCAAMLREAIERARHAG